jgi:hypothetical protein
MNRESANTVLLVTCLGSILYVGFLVSQKPSIQEIENEVDTIIAVRHKANRAFETLRLERCIREAFDDRAAGQQEGFSVEETITVGPDTESKKSLAAKEQDGSNLDRIAPNAKETVESEPKPSSSAGELDNAESETSDSTDETGENADNANSNSR